jgi:hypothetical protein
MKLTVDAHSRIASPELFRPKAAYDATKLPDGTIQLVELVPEVNPRPRLIRRDGHTYLQSDQPITNEDVAAAMAAFP